MPPSSIELYVTGRIKDVIIIRGCGVVILRRETDAARGGERMLDDACQLLLLSAKNPDALRELARGHADFLQPMQGWSLISMLYGEEGGAALMQTEYAQPALFAIEYALAQLWQSCGMQPDYLIGHSLGEYVAACLAGVFSLEDGLQLVAHRGRLMQHNTEPGAMLAVSASAECIDRFLAASQMDQEAREPRSCCRLR